MIVTSVGSCLAGIYHIFSDCEDVCLLVAKDVCKVMHGAERAEPVSHKALVKRAVRPADKFRREKVSGETCELVDSYA